MGPSNCVKPMGNISLQESTEVLLFAVNWGMKAHQQAAVLRSDQRVACMGQRPEGCSALCVCMCECMSRYCLDEQSCEARSVSEWGGVLGRGSTKPHEGWRASKNVLKLYSFSIKGRTERGKKKLGTLTCHSLKNAS